jgi:hypothetical protein
MVEGAVLPPCRQGWGYSAKGWLLQKALASFSEAKLGPCVPIFPLKSFPVNTLHPLSDEEK